MAEEKVVIVDEKNRVVGSAGRKQMRAGNLIHRSSYVMVQGAGGRLFVQRRALTKDLYPGLYEPGCAGVVSAAESYQQAACRELAEELGVRGVPLRHLFDFYQETAENRVWGRVFCCRWQGDFVLQQEELDWGGFMTMAEIHELAAARQMTPDGILILSRLQPYL